MNRICKQVSIESPASVMGKEYVFSYDVVVPDLPPCGARVKVNLLVLLAIHLILTLGFLTADVCWSLLQTEICKC